MYPGSAPRLVTAALLAVCTATAWGLDADCCVDGLEISAAGGIQIAVPHPAAYARIDATVRLGELDAPIRRTNQGGILCSLRRNQAQGKYNLLAFVGAGQMLLR